MHQRFSGCGAAARWARADRTTRYIQQVFFTPPTREAPALSAAIYLGAMHTSHVVLALAAMAVPLAAAAAAARGGRPALEGDGVPGLGPGPAQQQRTSKYFPDTAHAVKFGEYGDGGRACRSDPLSASLKPRESCGSWSFSYYGVPETTG